MIGACYGSFIVPKGDYFYFNGKYEETKMDYHKNVDDLLMTISFYEKIKTRLRNYTYYMFPTLIHSN